LASEDGVGGEIHLGEGVSIQSFSLTHSFQQKVFGYKWRGSTRYLWSCNIIPLYDTHDRRVYIPCLCVVYLQDGRVNRLFRNAHDGRVYIIGRVSINNFKLLTPKRQLTAAPKLAVVDCSLQGKF
jgi:hypothetical protein